MKDRYFASAKAVAMTGHGVGQKKNYRLGAVLIQKGQLVSVGVNSYKTHPKRRHRSEFPYLHAEQQAIFRYGMDRCEGLDLYVARIWKNNQYAGSKPCEVCQQLIDVIGIKNTYYIDDEGQFATL